MSTTTTAHPLPGRSAPAWGPGRALALVVGSLLALVALGLALAGVALVLAHVTARDASGFYTSPTERFTTSTFALTSEDIQIGDVRGHGADWALDALDATVRVRASEPNAGRVFIGIARTADVDRYLAESAYDEVTGVDTLPFGYDTTAHRGDSAPAIPDTQRFWAASAEGAGTQAVTWEPESGRWSVVVMNADGSPKVSADVNVAAKSSTVLPVGIVLLGLGVLGLAGAAGLIYVGAHEPEGTANAQAGVTPG
jgi:hypothetical protein